MTALRLTVIGVAALLLSDVALAEAPGVRIGRYSYQATPHRAEIGASIEVTTQTPGDSAAPLPRSDGSVGSPGGAPPTLALTLPSDSPLLRDSTPAGPGSLWYDPGAGESCVYIPEGTPLCYRLADPADPAGPAGGGGRIDPVALAAAVAARLPLLPGRVAVSPPRPRGGLTGVRSWFWLEPAPTTQRVSVSAGPETVAVTAVPEVQWEFGDGPGGGRAGVGDYRPERVPVGAVGHGYETRCLPGDRGRNPYVLASCGVEGYEVEASVTWSISYQASGPVPASGTLPARTTSTSMAFPVGESRAFLVAAGGGR
jgi:hypothetical protein